MQFAKELDNQMEDASPMERLAFDRRVKALTRDLPPLPDFSAFHERFSANDGTGTPEGDIREAFFLAYDEDNCDYLPLDGYRVPGEVTTWRAATQQAPGLPAARPGQRPPFEAKPAIRLWLKEGRLRPQLEPGDFLPPAS